VNLAALPVNLYINAKIAWSLSIILNAISINKGLFYFFASPKKQQKKSPENDYIPFSGNSPD
jgi:hypothetical protein